MFIRKERTHHSGSSNLSLNERLCHLANNLPEPLLEDHRASRSKLLRASHARSQEAGKRKLENSNVSPVEETKKFYESQGKVPILKTFIGYPRIFFLEEKDKQKSAFTGDSRLMEKVSLLRLRSKSSNIVNKTSSVIVSSTINANLSKDDTNKQKNQDEGLLERTKRYGMIQALQKVKHKNQLTLLIKNRLPELSQSLQESDLGNTGYLTPFLFEQAIKKLRIHENAVSKEDIKNLYDDYKMTPARLDYQNFIRSLEEFKFPYDQSYQNYDQSKLREYHTPNTYMTLGQTCQSANISDCRTLPYNVMINYFKKSRKVGNALKQFLPTKFDLNEYLGQTLKISKDELLNQKFSQKDFKSIVDGFLDKFNLSFLNQHELEGFFSSVLFNRHGFTNFEEIAKTIYEEKESDFLLKIQMKKKGPAPSNEVKPSEGAQTSISLPQTHEGVEDKQALGEEKITDHLDSSHTKLSFSKKILRSLIERKQNLNERNERKEDKDLEAILNEVENKVFIGTKSALKIFRDFDVDGDGYISHRDVVQKIKMSKIINEDSIPKFLRYLDPEKKGYVDFQRFSSKVRRNMINDDENGRSLRRTVSMLSKPDFEKDLQIVENAKLVIDSLRNKFDPAGENYKELKRKTRSSANPSWTNTFLNIQPNSGTSMFASEQERLDRRPSARTSFQVEDKLKITSTQERKLEIIRNNQNILNNRISEKISWLDQRDENKLKKKLMNQTVYENKMRNGNSMF